MITIYQLEFAFALWILNGLCNHVAATKHQFWTPHPSLCPLLWGLICQYWNLKTVLVISLNRMKRGFAKNTEKIDELFFFFISSSLCFQSAPSDFEIELRDYPKLDFALTQGCRGEISITESVFFTISIVIRISQKNPIPKFLFLTIVIDTSFLRNHVWQRCERDDDFLWQVGEISRSRFPTMAEKDEVSVDNIEGLLCC